MSVGEGDARKGRRKKIIKLDWLSIKGKVRWEV